VFEVDETLVLALMLLLLLLLLTRRRGKEPGMG
jgi:hypothetical protein